MATSSAGLRTPLIIIATVLCGAVLWIARDVAAPITLAIVIGVIAAPLLDLFKRIRIPESYGALVILLATLLGFAALILALEPLVWRIVDQMPSIRLELRSLVYEFQGVIRGLDDMNEQMKEALGAAKEASEEEAEGGAQLPTVTDALFVAPIIIGQMLIFAGTFYFFLVNRSRVYTALAGRLAQKGEGAVLQARFRRAEYLVSRYFATISIINFALGTALAGYLGLIGLPLPVVWGVGAALMNYVLYVGPACVAAGLLLAGIINFEGLMVVAPMAGYLCINMIEAQFVTPSLVGKHVSINPLAVFIALVFGLWFWGPIGGIVSIPIMVIVMALLDDPASRAADVPPPTPSPRSARA
ncbi:AI-2E family transporter [Roseivivax isoporae]|uniref:Permease n=1 Tax=Roseivivax isoporae LMG 25204 TaxID=1449351 RepID=X7F7S9_9RHOB|nr:AI-2E family transporter [Roseivivax isoporae]ETX28793.1 hypothetical protein RISW2_04645 [Roseivivax isoporae LMG 25204]